MPQRVTAERTSATFVDRNTDFRLPPGANVAHQFASLYFSRLCELRPCVEAAAAERWGREVLQRRVKTLDAEPGAPVLVVGTLYNEMKRKPNIMDEVNADVLESLNEEKAEAGDGKYCGEGDSLVIEDESGRLALRVSEALAAEILVTGAVVGVAGVVSEAGELHVEGIITPGLPAQAALARPVGVAADAGERYVCLVSGLRVGHEAQDMLPLQLLIEHLTGQLGGALDHRLQANVVRLVIAGNATSSPSSADESGGIGGIDVLKRVSAEEQRALASSVRTLDQFLTAVSAAMPVDLMPGPDDPCNFLLPQQPFHPCLVPQASQLATLNLCTNPYCTEVDGVRLLGTAGQPLDDMQKYLPGDDRLATLQRSLELRHLAPTAPDTLGCYPFAHLSEDPFVMRACPHVYFAGNQPRFETSLVDGPDGQRVRLITVPDFATEHTAVLVNLDTLDARPMRFAGLDAAAAEAKPAAAMEVA